MDIFLKDLRFALRTLRRQPAFTATVVGTLTLAIGASTGIFSIVESTLLRPLPFRTPERIAFLWGVAGPQRAIRGGSIIEVQDWARLNRSFESVSVNDQTSLNLRTPDGTDRIQAEMVSASYFPMLGASAAVGRVFTAAEDSVPDANPVVVISDGMWTTRFNRDPRIVGSTLTLNDAPFTVIGVMRPGFKGLGFNTDIWFPSMMARANGAPTDLSQRGSRWLGAIGRLKQGVTLQAAQADLERVGAQLARDYPNTNRERSVQVMALRDSYLGSTRTLVIAVFAAVGLLLLIACANVVGLQLVRTSGRRRELALRLAIGADRQRLAQQLTVEALVLAVSAAALGLLVAKWGLSGLMILVPSGLLPSYATPSINATAFAFSLVTAVGCGLVFGLLPALRAGRVNLVDSLKEGSRGSAAGFARGGKLGSQQLLVVGQTALAVVLLVGAGLFVRTLQRQLAVAPGFEPRGVLVAQISIPRALDARSRRQLANSIEARLAAIPSVRSVTVASDLPLVGGTSATFVQLPDVNQPVRIYRHAVAPSFFKTIGAQVRSGRAFTSSDRDSTPAVAMINESTERRFWPGQSAVGKVLRLGDSSAVTIVGVVGDVRFRDLTTSLATSEPDVYFPYAQRPGTALQIAIRSDLDAAAIATSVRRELATLDRRIPVFSVQPLSTFLDQQTASARFASTLLGIFGLAALLLTAVGLYGVLAFLVSLRQRELGIRLALGASSTRVLRGIVGQGVTLVALGIVFGGVSAAMLTGWIATQLFGVSARDPLVFTSVPLALLLIAILASWVPARRAARVDPQLALRSE
jgi:putative ABC transport system permease protein